MTLDARTIERSNLEGKLLPELQQLAQTLGVSGYQRLRKGDLIEAIVSKAAENGSVPVGENAIGNGGSPGARGGGQSGNSQGGGDTDDDADDDTGDDTDDDVDDDETEDGEGTSGPAAGPGNDDGAGRGRGDGSGGDQQGRGQQRDGRGGGTATMERERPRRLTREERRRQREERRQREVEAREEELANAPSRTGILDVLPEGYGFLRTSGYLPGQDDVYVSLSQIRRFALRKGDDVTGQIRQPRDNEKYFALLRIETVNQTDPDTARQRRDFDKLTPLFPDRKSVV